MGAEQQARRQLVEAMALAAWQATESDSDFTEELDREMYRAEAEAALTVVETLRTPCDNCLGVGYQPANELVPNLEGSVFCMTCGGTGLGLLAVDAMRGHVSSHLDRNNMGISTAVPIDFGTRPTETKP